MKLWAFANLALWITSESEALSPKENFHELMEQNIIVSDGTMQTSKLTLHKFAQHLIVDIYNVVHYKCVTQNMDKMQNQNWDPIRLFKL